MQFYFIKDTLEPCSPKDIGLALQKDGQEGSAQKIHPYSEPGERPQYQYVAVLSFEEWAESASLFSMGIELGPDLAAIHSTKAEVNYDSLTGNFLIPDRADITGKSFGFSFALDEKGIVIIDDSGKAAQIIDTIRSTRRWKEPCLERFLYDFLEVLVDSDRALLEGKDKELDQIEDQILAQKEEPSIARINEIRSEMRALRVHYEQLIDMTQELEENENGFFDEDKLRYLHLFMNRALRLSDMATSIQTHAIEVRDLYHTQLEVKQNHTMTLLTVIATIFMPLTLITGWYGMNFHHMPELEFPWAYPAVLLVCLAIAAGCLIFFKKKKWM